jgi:hypothetical protein
MLPVYVFIPLKASSQYWQDTITALIVDLASDGKRPRQAADETSDNHTAKAPKDEFAAREPSASSASGFGCDGVYVDQVAVVPGFLCFGEDGTGDRTRSGTAGWVAGGRSMHGSRLFGGAVRCYRIVHLFV